ncbi:hypothetical protein JCGZ_13103 [Jatropha curcas]|uniref:Uncharacterized protein n=1 Tax=Jatropha curcas TaxID=180498 RepID=A0A067KE63_JATCU|nr:hypothetical protein JCGZ_13103 [Jatropha curcas]
MESRVRLIGIDKEQNLNADHDPVMSNALMAVLKRAQTHQLIWISHHSTMELKGVRRTTWEIH